MRKSKHNKKPLQERLQEQEEKLKQQEERDRLKRYIRERLNAQQELFPGYYDAGQFDGSQPDALSEFDK